MTSGLEKATRGTFSATACWLKMMFTVFSSFRVGTMRRLGLGLSLAASAVLLAYPVPAKATTLQRQSLSDLAKKAEFVFEGQPVSRSVEALPDGQGARTCFTFNVIQAIAGTHPGNTVRLCFFGGMVADRGFAVSDLNMPTIGEHGVYLVESTSQPMLNPLIGWDQGHFLVTKDNTGVLRVTTADHRRVTGLAPEAAQPTESAPAIGSASGATAAGVAVDDQPDLSGAMSRDAFVKELRSFHDR
jgi:hypothetical protein